MHKPLFTSMLLALCSSSVNALPIATQSVSFDPISFSVSSTFANNNLVTRDELRSLTFNKFDVNTGVLTGVSSRLSFNPGGEQRLSASGTSGGTSPALQSSGFSQASSSLLGVGFLTQLNDSMSNSCRNPVNGIGTLCFPTGVTNLNTNASMTKVDATWFSMVTDRTVVPSDSNLNAYVGAGTLASILTVQSRVSMLASPYTKQVTGATATLSITDLTGAQSLKYTYLNHANASFTSGVDTSALSHEFDDNRFDFSIFNFGNADTTKLDYLGVNCTGDCDDFKLTLAALSDLGAGSHFDGFIDELYQDVVGTYAATYEFLFSDDTSVGATSSHRQNTLLLNVSGSVVPEPGTIALLFAGLGLIGIGARRRSHKAVI